MGQAWQPADDFMFFHGHGNTDHHFETGFLVRQSIISSVKRVKCIRDRMSNIALKVRWCCIIILNVHMPSEDKSDDTNDSFYEELERVLD
jgi:hypothetical protein